jgi:hypothetical protein
MIHHEAHEEHEGKKNFHHRDAEYAEKERITLNLKL